MLCIWKAGCGYKLKPVTQGSGLALMYRLVVTYGPKPSLKDMTGIIAELTQVITAWLDRAEAGSQKFYMLDQG